MSNFIEINLIQKEAKTLKFTVTNKKTGVVVDVSSVTAILKIKRTLSTTTYLAEKADSDFNKTLGLSGILSVGLTSSDLDFTNTAYIVLKITFSATNIDKTIYRLHITESGE